MPESGEGSPPGEIKETPKVIELPASTPENKTAAPQNETPTTEASFTPPKITKDEEGISALASLATQLKSQKSQQPSETASMKINYVPDTTASELGQQIREKAKELSPSPEKDNTEESSGVNRIGMIELNPKDAVYNNIREEMKSSLWKQLSSEEINNLLPEKVIQLTPTQSTTLMEVIGAISPKLYDGGKLPTYESTVITRDRLKTQKTVSALSYFQGGNNTDFSFIAFCRRKDSTPEQYNQALKTTTAAFNEELRNRNADFRIEI